MRRLAEEAAITAGVPRRADDLLQRPRSVAVGTEIAPRPPHQRADVGLPSLPDHALNETEKLAVERLGNCRCQERWHSAESAESDLKVCIRRAA
jgi:hypothetical protein